MIDRLTKPTRLIHIMLKKQAFATQASKKKLSEVGKYMELPYAEHGKVVVRFPPEASGYLHVGHAKAALLNQYYQKYYDGKLILRIDDTNPAKENVHFEQVIKEDLTLLQIEPDKYTHSSDYFDLMLELCEKLLRDGRAFVDDINTDTMSRERNDGIDSRNRNNSPTTNLNLWNEMISGTSKGQECCVRIKIDMKHRNSVMRDPIIYRSKIEEHARTGNKYKVYPTYDFACPIIDSIEGVTHALRSLEYKDWRDQYYFICDTLGLRKPHVWEFSRLNMSNTVMSKRKLSLLVEKGFVDGWDDPRMPTVRGVFRRGMRVEGLRRFIMEQGGSRAIATLQWEKLWRFNKKVIDPLAPRYTALECSTTNTNDGKLVPVKIRQNFPEETRTIKLNDKNPDPHSRELWFGQNLVIEQIDAGQIKEGDTLTLMNWGNLKIVEINKHDNRVLEIIADLDLENKEFKRTMKVTWLCDSSSASNIPVKTLHYDHIITKEILTKDDNWLDFVNRNSVVSKNLIGEVALSKVKKGEIIQLLRKGNFICDQAMSPKSPLILIEIPSG